LCPPLPRTPMLSFPTRRSSDLETRTSGGGGGSGLSSPGCTDAATLTCPPSVRVRDPMARLPFPQAIIPALVTVTVALGCDDGDRSEEHTSELKSLAYLVCRLLI